MFELSFCKEAQELGGEVRKPENFTAWAITCECESFSSEWDAHVQIGGQTLYTAKGLKRLGHWCLRASEWLEHINKRYPKLIEPTQVKRGRSENAK